MNNIFQQWFKNWQKKGKAMSTTPQSTPITSSLTISNGQSTVTLVAGSIEAAASLGAAISGNAVAEEVVPLVSQLFNTALAKYENGATVVIDDAAIAALFVTDDILEPTDRPPVPLPEATAPVSVPLPGIGSAPVHQVVKVVPVVTPDPVVVNTPAPAASPTPVAEPPAAATPPASEPAAVEPETRSHVLFG